VNTQQPIKTHWNSTTVLEALNEINEHHDELQNHLKFLLDDFHGVERSLRYYEIIAGDWFEYFLHWVYAEWKEVLLRNIPLVKSAIPVTPVNKFSSPKAFAIYHEHLRWSIGKLVAGETAMDWEFAREHVRIQTGQNRSGRNWLIQQFRKLATQKPNLLICQPYYKCSKIKWIATLWRWRNWAAFDHLDYPISVTTSVDKEWRKAKSIEVGQATNWPEIVKAMLPLHMPPYILEGFTEFRNQVIALPIARPKATYSANALWSNLIYKILNAEWQQQGTKILYHQHGGGYGIDKIHMIENHETRVADQYYSWGWQRTNRLVKPLSPPAFNIMKRKKRWLLLMCEDFPMVPLRIHFQPMPGTVQTMHRQTIDFLQELKFRDGLMVRPYSIEYGWMAIKSMRDAAPDANFDLPPKAPSSFQRFAQSRLVVHNYLGTSWLETLALNIPTVCFYDPETYVFREEAQLLIEKLAKVGVLHISGVAAAHFVSNLDGEPQEWWNKPNVQETRQKFIQKYACNSPDWVRQWEKEFSSQI
jgi:putative transferase (TIGR04331 family)